jgi:N-acetylneuraminic acid mutarotase
MMIEPLEPRRLFTTVAVSAPRGIAYEGGSATRFFYIHRDPSPNDQKLVVHFIVGGKAKQGLDYNPIGTAVTIKPGSSVRRIEVTAIDDGLMEPRRESVTLTLLPSSAYTISQAQPAATIRIASNDESTPLPASLNWTSLAPSPIPRAEALRAVVGLKLYVLGGFSGDLGPVKRSDVYDYYRNRWTRIADLPTRLTHAGVAADDTSIYVAGGYVGIGDAGYNQQFGTRDTWKLDLTSGQWTSMPQLPRALAGGGLALLGRTLHYLGGNDSNRADAGDHYALDLDRPELGWKPQASMPDPRSHFASAIVRGRIYVLGGQHGNDAGLTTVPTVSIYDPATDTWSAGTPMPVAVSHIASTGTAAGNNIWIFGGETSHEHATERVSVYDTIGGTWTSMTPLPQPRFSGVAATIAGSLFFTTGSSQTTTWIADLLVI